MRRYQVRAYAGRYGWERPGTWMAILAGGAVPYLDWDALMLATFIPDPRDCHGVAMQLLVEGRHYSTVNAAGPDGQPTGTLVEPLAWRPPRLPFPLAGEGGVFEVGTWAIIGSNLAICASGALALGMAAVRLIEQPGAAPVLLASTAWPKHIGCTGVPLTEDLSLLLPTLGVLPFDLALAGGRRSLVHAGCIRRGSPGAPEPTAASGAVSGITGGRRATGDKAI